jgi:3-deoxy-7-phosphoheptulonate synthase
MAGPCAVESERQLLQTAEAVAAAGARVLRGGAYKPRSSPYAFQGLGIEGLKLLSKARKQTGLAIVTEVMSEEDVGLIAEYADIMQVGTRSMENYSLLEVLGQCGRPVLLKRGMTARLDELLRSAQVIAANGNPEIILCERGIRTFETATRNTLDIAAVPVLKTVSRLPVIVDPATPRVCALWCRCWRAPLRSSERTDCWWKSIPLPTRRFAMVRNHSHLSNSKQ